MKNFRVNSLMAIEQATKIRPVLNVSLPKDYSFNDNVESDALEKIKMSSARKFSFAVVKCGKNAIMSKFDMVDANKNIPAPLDDLRLQGFQWLSMFFVELRQIFGAKTAVANFDILGNSILSIVKNKCNIPSEFIHRTLDDVPFVAPVASVWPDVFVKCYVEICKRLNVILADNCPNLDKAFMKSTKGKVLGIMFDTENLSFCFPKEKKEKVLRLIFKCKAAEKISLKNFQSLMGNLNDLSIMCPFMRVFKFPLFLCMKECIDDFVTLSNIAKDDLNIWIRFLCDSNDYIPICHEYVSPPIACKYFTSDAAGCSSESNNSCGLGCGNVGFDHNGIIIFATQLFWPEGILNTVRDMKSSSLGSKTTTLEFLGIILPFLIIPEQLANQNVIVKVDNTGCFFGWINRRAKGDIFASILKSALHLISNYLCCIVHIEHLPRKSTWDALTTDRMSRNKTTTRHDRALLNSFALPGIPVCLENWMSNPTEDWGLAYRLLVHVKKMHKMK